MLTKRPTIGEVLAPTKGGDSYAKIAIKANEWLRKQQDAGRQTPIGRMSSEQVRKIFTDCVERPAQIYLEALAEVQGADIEMLYRIAGYAPLSGWEAETDPVKRVDVFLAGMENLSEFAKEEIRRVVREEAGRGNERRQ